MKRARPVILAVATRSGVTYITYTCNIVRITIVPLRREGPPFAQSRGSYHEHHQPAGSQRYRQSSVRNRGVRAAPRRVRSGVAEELGGGVPALHRFAGAVLG